MGVWLLGSLMMPPALAQDDGGCDAGTDVGSFVVFPLFDVIGGNQTKIRVTCFSDKGTRIRFTYICQPLDTSTTSAFCPSFDEAFDCTAHQTLVLDVGTELAGACPTGQGFIVAFPEAQCTPASPTFNPNTQTCATATGGALSLGEFGPTSHRFV
jgi:hypothetical protein